MNNDKLNEATFASSTLKVVASEDIEHYENVESNKTLAELLDEEKK